MTKLKKIFIFSVCLFLISHATSTIAQTGLTPSEIIEKRREEDQAWDQMHRQRLLEDQARLRAYGEQLKQYQAENEARDKEEFKKRQEEQDAAIKQEQEEQATQEREMEQAWHENKKSIQMQKAVERLQHLKNPTPYQREYLAEMENFKSHHYDPRFMPHSNLLIPDDPDCHLEYIPAKSYCIPVCDESGQHCRMLCHKVPIGSSYHIFHGKRVSSLRGLCPDVR